MHQFADTSRAVGRRGFLQGVAAVGVAGLMGGGGARMGSAADPPQRVGGSHMKLSLAAYSFNSVLPRRPNERQRRNARMTLEDFIDYCAEMQLDGTELTSYYFPAEVTNDYLMQIKERTFRLGLDISGTAIGNNFCLPAGEERDAQLALTREWIDHSSVMGAPVIRIFAGEVPRGGSEEEALELCVAGINESLEYAATKGVFLALENHGGITATADQLLRIVERVQSSPWFGVNLDGGNFRTEDPYADLERIVPYTINAQIKVSVQPRGAGKQQADYRRIVGMLRDAGYRGYVVLEYEEPEPPREVIPAHLAELRELLAG